eukprot:CAMPEP_0115872190 /NCGR_PEP_ID=MMETSP0287-20121206/23288_1 /TAXON_ID=412157 /ORGANISM="Chrysochromulina rotalis, Strain UIO044" /LENGTH=145 /DNA_ID=CAMNT_0003327083 /DNA_START=98 /DNA_END=532 /DNA_ORIENTATION=-
MNINQSRPDSLGFSVPPSSDKTHFLPVAGPALCAQPGARACIAPSRALTRDRLLRTSHPRAARCKTRARRTPHAAPSVGGGEIEQWEGAMIGATGGKVPSTAGDGSLEGVWNDVDGVACRLGGWGNVDAHSGGMSAAAPCSCHAR